MTTNNSTILDNKDHLLRIIDFVLSQSKKMGATDAEADIVAFVATTASAPYVVANNGTDTVTMFVDGAEGNFEIDFDNLNDVAGNYTGTDDYDLLQADGSAYLYKVADDGSASYISNSSVDGNFEIGVSFTYISG